MHIISVYTITREEAIQELVPWPWLVISNQGGHSTNHKLLESAARPTCSTKES